MAIADDTIISSNPVGGFRRIKKFDHEKIKAAKLILWNLLLITSGSLMCAQAINGILIPHGFLSGCGLVNSVTEGWTKYCNPLLPRRPN